MKNLLYILLTLIPSLTFGQFTGDSTYSTARATSIICTIDAGANDTICSDSTNHLLIAELGAGYDSIRWSGSEGMTQTDNDTCILNVTAADISAGSVTATVTGYKNGTSATDSVGVVINDCILVSGDYYVSPDGSNSNPGTFEEPFLTINYGYNQCSSGDTLILLNGTYLDGLEGNRVLDMDANGTLAEPIVVKAYNKWGAIIDGQDALTYPVYMEGNYNVIDGLKVIGGVNSGVMVYGRYNTVTNCEFTKNGYYTTTGTAGILSDQNGNPYGNTYTYNYVHSNGQPEAVNSLDQGMYLTDDSITCYGNICVNHPGWGIQLQPHDTMRQAMVYNNFSAWNGRGGIVVLNYMDNVDIANNIFYDNDNRAIDCGLMNQDQVGDPGNYFRYNLYYSNPASWDLDCDTFLISNNLTSDPLITVNDTFNYTLGIGSPAIDSGVDVGFPYLGSGPDRGVERESLLFLILMMLGSWRKILYIT